MKRILWDIGMLVVFLAVMSFHFVPKMLHEILGVALPLAVVRHLWLNRRYFSALVRGRWDMGRILRATVNLLLMISLLLTLFTGICLSNYLFKEMIPLELARNITLHQIHVSLPFLLLILIGLHFGLHWKAWWERLKNRCRWQQENMPYPLLAKGGVLLVTALGVYGSFQNRVGDHLLMKHVFATPATNHPGAVYAILLLGIMGLYAVLSYGWQAWEYNRKLQK